MRGLLTSTLLAATACATPIAPAPQQPTTAAPFTVDWIYGPESAALTTLPQVSWQQDGTALLFDPLLAADAQGIDVLVPESAERRRLVEARDALASLREILADKTPEELPWPTTFDGRSFRGALILEGDVFVLELPTSRFVRLTQTEAEEKSLQFSPDGDKLAFVRDSDLYAFDFTQRSEKRLTQDGSETVLNGTLSWVYWEEIFGRRDVGYWWSEDSRYLAFLRSDQAAVNQVHFLDFQPAAPRVIEQRYPKAGSKNPAVKVGVVAAAGGAPTWVQLAPDQYEYIARVQWLPDCQRLAVQTLDRPQQNLDLYFADRQSGAVQHILRETQEAWVNIHDDLYFLDNGTEFLWVSERSGYSHLYRYRLDGTLVNAVTRGAWALRSSGGVFWLRQAVAAIDEDNDWVYFTTLKDSSTERHLYRVHLDGTHLQRLSQGSGTHKVLFREDGAFYFDVYANRTTPPGLNLHYADGKKRLQVAHSDSASLEALKLQYPERLVVSARDGFNMPGELFKPKSFDSDRRYPLILNVYAGPSAPMVKDDWQSSIFYDNLLLAEGYLVARVDNRSATAISKRYEDTILNQMSSDSELNDIVDAVRWLKDLPYVDLDRIGIWGWSGGGTCTLLAMTRSEEFRAGIAVAPVTDWHYYDTKWAEAVMKTPQANAEGYEKTSLVKRAADLHGRLLLVHGTYDDNVHPQNSWHLIDELVKAGKNFDMMFYPMRKHGIADAPARTHLFTKMLEFWRRNL